MLVECGSMPFVLAQNVNVNSFPDIDGNNWYICRLTPKELQVSAAHVQQRHPMIWCSMSQ